MTLVEWRRPPPSGVIRDSQEAMEANTYMQVACTCLQTEHHFRVDFTIKDCNDDLVAQASTSPFKIIDRHNTSNNKLSAPGPGLLRNKRVNETATGMTTSEKNCLTVTPYIMRLCQIQQYLLPMKVAVRCNKS